MPSTRTTTEDKELRLQRGRLAEGAHTALTLQTGALDMLGPMVARADHIARLAETLPTIPALAAASAIAERTVDQLRNLEVALASARMQMTGARRHVEEAIAAREQEGTDTP